MYFVHHPMQNKTVQFEDRISPCKYIKNNVKTYRVGPSMYSYLPPLVPDVEKSVVFTVKDNSLFYSGQETVSLLKPML